MKKMLTLLSVWLIAGCPSQERELERELERKPEVSVLRSFAKTLPDAVSEGFLIDGTYCAVAWGMGGAAWLSVPLCAIYGTVGYSIRKTCNDYSNDGKNSIFCGFVGGSIKYSGKALVDGTFTLVEPILGAFDAASYEGTEKYRGTWQTAEMMTLEAVVSGLCFMLRANGAPGGLFAEMKSGAAVGLVLSGAIYTVYKWYGQPVVDGIKKWLPLTE